MTNFQYHEPAEQGHAAIKAWTRGVHVEQQAIDQLRNVASLPFIHKHVAAMPDVHWGMGATVGSVIPTRGAIIPAAVGVDIGCGMMAVRLDGLSSADLPDSLAGVRSKIEAAIPVGFAKHSLSKANTADADRLYQLIAWLEDKHPSMFAKRKDPAQKISAEQFGTLGGGNHFIELCLDESGGVWVMLHSGSRGIGNVIGTYFIQAAREDMRRHFINLPDKDLAYLVEGTEHFSDYSAAVQWAQDYARANREEMMRRILAVLTEALPGFYVSTEAVNCHHNYVERENHFGANVWLTRKGAVRARKGDLGIIPGSMGAKSFIVRGKGNAEAFDSCSHGAGRMMGRKEAKRRFTVADHEAATQGVECRKDEGVIDETPGAYKDIDAVMAAQSDLVEIVHTLKQVMCVKG